MSMSQLRSRTLRGGVTAALMATAALGATAVPAMAGPTVTLKYICTYPLITPQPLSIVISSDIPSTIPAGTQTNVFHIDSVATAGGQTITGLTLVNAKSVEGVATAGSQISGPEANLPVTVPIQVAKYTLPAGQTTGDLVLNASGTTPALTFSKVGVNTIKLNSLALNLTARRADNSPITEFSGLQTVPATDNDPNTFDVSCALDPAAGTQNTTIGTINVTAPTDSTAPTAPGQPVVGTRSASTANLSWPASTDAKGVTGYDVYSAGNRVASTSGGTAVQVTSLGSAQPYSFTVKARDAAGNVSAASPAVSTTTYTESQPKGTPDSTPFAPLNVTYQCQYPLIGAQPLSVKVTTNIPKSTYAGKALPAFNITSVATVPATTWDALSLVGAKTIQGGATATSRVGAPGFTLPVAVPITVPATTVPATRSAFNLTASGVTPALSFPRSGTAKIVLDSIKLNLTAKRADGSIIQLPSLGADSDGNPNTFDVSCSLSPVNQSGVIGWIQLFVDDVAPTIPTGLKISGLAPTGVIVSWNASTDNAAVTGYEITYNGSVRTSTTNRIVLQGLTPSTFYRFTVKARDAAGNRGPANGITFTTKAAAAAKSAPDAAAKKSTTDKSDL